MAQRLQCCVLFVLRPASVRPADTQLSDWIALLGDIHRDGPAKLMLRWIGYRWFCWRLFVRETREAVLWKAAWLLPRKVALFAFVRVCGATGDGPGSITYDSAYKAWEAGAGK